MAGKVAEYVLADARARYLQAILAGEFDAASAALAQLVSAQVGLAQIYGEVVAPAMKGIGELWCEGEINVAQEHLATQITLGQMAKLRFMQPVRAPLPYTAMMACVEGESHFIGARMAADLLQAEGWSVDFLGPDVPNRALIDIAVARRPDLLGVAVRMEAHIGAIEQLLEELMALAEPPKIVVGGWLDAKTKARIDELDGVESATEIGDAVSLARRLFAPNRTEVQLGEYLKALGQRIRGTRQRIGWTQDELAKATKLTRAYLVSVEGGKQNLTIDVVVRIANALNLSPTQLIGENE